MARRGRRDGGEEKKWGGVYRPKCSRPGRQTGKVARVRKNPAPFPKHHTKSGRRGSESNEWYLACRSRDRREPSMMAGCGVLEF